MNCKEQEGDQAKVSRLCRNATFHAIRGLNQINDQSERLWSEFATCDCRYHLKEALAYLQQIDEVINTLPERKQ